MAKNIGHDRQCKTLCNVLDSLRKEAPIGDPIYQPTPMTTDALIQTRSKALLKKHDLASQNLRIGLNR